MLWDSLERRGVWGRMNTCLWMAELLHCSLETVSQHRSVQFSSVAQLCSTLCDPMNRTTSGLSVHHQLPEFTQTHVHRVGDVRLMWIKSVMPSSHLILGHPLLLLPPIPPTIRVFSNESTLCTRWPKYWRFSLSVSPSSEHPGLVSFRMNLYPNKK